MAEHFYEKEGKWLYRYRFFFPNKRSGSFFLHYLRQAAKREPLLLPEVTTLGTFLRRASNLPEESVNNELLLIYHLYSSYKSAYIDTAHTFETFYEIGKQLLADFNDIDNHLADAESIFKNLDQLDELTEAPGEILTENQVDALEHFAPNLRMNLDKGYSEFWKHVPEIYAQFKTILEKEKLTYNGMLMRNIVEKLENGELDLFKDNKVNVFIGLNALSKSEQKILKHFKENSKTLFYWDYDSYLLKQKFTQKSRKESLAFPEPTDRLAFERDKELTHQPKLQIISIPSKLGQANYIAQKIIPELQSNQQINLSDPNTVIVLPDESQLTNLLSNLQILEVGDAPLKLNITMGFPIKYLPAIAKLLHLLNLQRLAYGRQKRDKYGREEDGMPVWRREEVIDLLGLELDQSDFDHATLLNKDNEKQLYFTEQELSDKIAKGEHDDLRLLFYLDKAEQGDLLHNTLAILSHLQKRFEEDASVKMSLTVVEELLNEIKGSLDSFVSNHQGAGEELTLPLLYDLICTTISRARIPFAGEPLEGVQVMGILEARSIDFQNIIVMDAGEGLLPAKSRKYGLILQYIRERNYLPTYRWQDEIRAYNFFHMICRSERLYALYDSRKTERASGEPSRYLTLLTHIYGVEAKQTHAYFSLFPVPQRELEIDREKVNAYREGLASTEGGTQVRLSPSGLINYLTCPRKFYYQNILGLRDLNDLTDVLENNDVGTITHKALEVLYSSFKGKKLTKEGLESISDDDINSAIQDAYNELLQTDGSQPNGYFEMYKNLIFQDIKNTIKLDIDNNLGFTYIGGEQIVSTTYTYGQNGETINLIGFIDRIDKDCQGRLRLVDYKTGKDKPSFNLANSFNPDSSTIDRAPIQLLTYCVMYLKDHAGFSSEDIAPLLFKVRSGEQHWLEQSVSRYEKVTIEQFSTIEDEFRERLNEVLCLIAEADEDFLPNNRKGSCNYCAGKDLCNKAKIY